MSINDLTELEALRMGIPRPQPPRCETPKHAQHPEASKFAEVVDEQSSAEQREAREQATQSDNSETIIVLPDSAPEQQREQAQECAR